MDLTRILYIRAVYPELTLFITVDESKKKYTIFISSRLK